MAYRIDFSESIWDGRRRRKAGLRLFLAAALAGAAWGVYDVYTTYNEPTLDMKLAEYESVARPIEEMNRAWDVAAKEFGAMLRYYRLLWAGSPTNYLSAVVAADAPRPVRGLRPQAFSMKTGGACSLSYVFTFGPGDKAEQTRGLEDAVANAVTSVVAVAGGRVDVQGVRHENLLNVDELAVTATFSLPDARTFPAKEKSLADCVGEIAAMRRRVQEVSVPDAGDAKGTAKKVQQLMLDYLSGIPSNLKGRPDFPNWANAVSVAGLMREADEFARKNKAPDDPRRAKLKEAWGRIGGARFPWDRLRALDNDALVERTKALGTVSDGVRRFKAFLEQRHADCLRKLEPFVDGYGRNDVFNEPLVETDLRERVAKAAGLSGAVVSFRDEAGAEEAVLEKDDETFTFTWVRWTLSVGPSGGGEQGAGGDERETVTLAKVADCARRAMELGPGYALDSVRIAFDADGSVSDAVMEGLLPVKKSEPKKEAAGNVN